MWMPLNTEPAFLSDNPRSKLLAPMDAIQMQSFSGVNAVANSEMGYISNLEFVDPYPLPQQNM